MAWLSAIAAAALGCRVCPNSLGVPDRRRERELRAQPCAAIAAAAVRPAANSSFAVEKWWGKLGKGLRKIFQLFIAQFGKSYHQ